MAIGERIRFIRNLRGMTQKYLGMAIGFTEKTADVRMAQYESGSRTPKEKMVEDFANVLGVCPQALTVPDIDNYIGLAHTLFTLEDLYGVKIENNDGQLSLVLDRENKSYLSMFDIWSAWSIESKKLKNGEITKEEYDQWRYNYPKMEAERTKEKLDELRAEKEISSKTEGGMVDLKNKSELEAMKCKNCPPFENAYEHFIGLLEDYYISKYDGKERIAHELKNWDKSAQVQIVKVLIDRLGKTMIDFDPTDLLNLIQ